MTEEQAQAVAEAIGRMLKEMLDADPASSLNRIDTAAERGRLEGLAGHTPGPWTHHKCLCGHRSCNQYTISTQGGVGFRAEDARLIAAAPDLLTTVHRLLDALDAERARFNDVFGQKRHGSAAHTLTFHTGDPA